MNQTNKLRFVSAFAFAVLIMAIGWTITNLLGFAPGGFTLTVAITLALGAGIWAFVVNQLEAETPGQYFLQSIQYRPLILSFGLFVALVLLWGIARAIVEWAIEPNMYDYGPCSFRFPVYPCGDQDLNSGRRYLADDLIDKVASAVFLLVPLSLAVQRVRKVFR